MELFIDNSVSMLKNAPYNLEKELSDRLSYIMPGYMYSKNLYRTKWDGRIRLFNRRNKTFPTGLLSDVFKTIKELNISCKIKDLRTKPKKKLVLPTIKKPSKLRPYQKKAVEQANKYIRGVIDLPPGTGKTRIALEIITNRQVSTLFTAPTVSIALQTYKRFKEVFGRKYVGIIYSGKKEYHKPITVACINSLKSKKLPKNFFKQFDMLIVDEFHHSSAKTYTQLNKKAFQDIYYKYGLTGTFFREDGTDLQMRGVLSNVLYKMDSKKAIADGWLVKPEFHIYEISIPKVPSKNYQLVYKYGIVKNSKRNRHIVKMAKKFTGKYVLILVKEIEHGEYLAERIPNSVFLNGQNSGTKNSKLIEKFERQEIGPIIATSVIGEGTDIPCIDVIINAQGMKAEGFILQRIGRGMRLAKNKNKLIFIDYLDKGNHFLTRHSKIRIETYQKHLTNNIKYFTV